MAPSNRGLVRLVLSQETRVRIPLELPKGCTSQSLAQNRLALITNEIIREDAIRESVSVTKSHAKKTLALAGASRYNL